MGLRIHALRQTFFHPAMQSRNCWGIYVLSFVKIARRPGVAKSTNAHRPMSRGLDLYSEIDQGLLGISKEH